MWTFSDTEWLHYGDKEQPSHEKATDVPLHLVSQWTVSASNGQTEIKKARYEKIQRIPYCLQSTRHRLFLVEWLILGILLTEGSDSICLLQVRALSQWTVLIIPDNNKWSQSKEEPGGILLIKALDAPTLPGFPNWAKLGRTSLDAGFLIK